MQNRIAEFHTELELLSPSALENPCIRHAIELEQSFMEGAYNRVLSARQTVPHETYVYFMDLLAKTVRYGFFCLVIGIYMVIDREQLPDYFCKHIFGYSFYLCTASVLQEFQPLPPPTKKKNHP